MSKKYLGLCMALLAVNAVAAGVIYIPLSNASDFAIGRFNGKSGFAVSKLKENKVEIYTENSPGQYDLWRTLELKEPYGLAAGDFDGDGADDLAVNTPTRHFAVCLSTNDYRPTYSYYGALRFYGKPQVARLNNDPKHWFFGAGGILWRLSGRSLSSGYVSVPERDRPNRPLAFGDVDGDGNNDIVALEWMRKGMERVLFRIYYGPIFDPDVRPEDVIRFEEMELPFAATSLAVGDLDGDGKAEIALSCDTNTVIKQSSGGEVEIPDGGSLVIYEGILIVCRSSGTRFYKGLETTPFKRDSGGYRSCIIKDGVFYGLSRIDLRIYDLGVTPQVETIAPQISAEPAARPVVKPKELKPDTRWSELGPQATNVAERLKYDPMMFPYYTGKILPTPVKAIYSDEFLPIDDVAIVTAPELDPAGAQIAMLTSRIQRYGGKCTFITAAEVGKYPLTIAIGDTGLAPELQAPDRPEGYAFKQVKPGLIAVKYHDKLALTWAMSSLGQLVREGQIRIAEVEDYPAVARRFAGITNHDMPDGVIHFTEPARVNLSVTMKANEILLDYTALIPNRGKYRYWRDPRPEAIVKQFAELGNQLNPLGITWYGGLYAFGKRGSKEHEEWMFDSKSDDDFKILYDYACMIADAGGNIVLYWEDHRMPIGQKDKANFGSMREADIYFLNRLYTALREKYPQIKFIFCPPFYLGPDGEMSNVDESREEYLRALGERAPKDIGIFWTGPRVGTTKCTKEHNRWITDLIGRKPLFWQNAADFNRTPRIYYMGDKLWAWRDYYYDGFYDDIEGYCYNFSQPCLSYLNLDYLWNPPAYDAENSSYETVSRFIGPENYDTIIRFNTALSSIARYGFRISPSAARNVKKLDEDLETAIAAFTEIIERRPATEVLNMEFMRPWINRAAELVAKLYNNRELADFANEAEKMRASAASETGYDERRDQLFTALDLDGGRPPLQYGAKLPDRSGYAEKKLATFIFGKRSVYKDLNLQFSVSPWPTEGDYELIICGLDDDSPVACPIKISLNNKVIYEGPAPFDKVNWTLRTFKVSGDLILRGNRLVISAEADSDNASGAPFCGVSYIVIRKLNPQ